MSQYTDAYLNENHNRGLGQGITPGTFLSSQLKGRAKSYATKYRIALERDLNRRIAEGSVLPYASVHGGNAYYLTATADAAREEMRARLVGGVA
jgi:hypothetical protein